MLGTPLGINLVGQGRTSIPREPVRFCNKQEQYRVARMRSSYFVETFWDTYSILTSGKLMPLEESTLKSMTSPPTGDLLFLIKAVDSITLGNLTR